MKMWAGRFEKESSKILDDFNSSIRVDSAMYKQDIMGSVAHVTMLSECGIIDKQDGKVIADELSKILAEIENGEIIIDMSSEDIHMFIEQILTERIGDTGKKLHTARSRNDQVALDTRMYVKDEILLVCEKINLLISTLCQKAEENLNTIMPGYTHLQIAQPITFAHHIMSYVEMFSRDLKRLKNTYEMTDVMPLGSGALASTTYKIDREMTKRLLGFSKITNNSLDGVSDRDFCLDTTYSMSMIMMHLSRFCEEIILWSSSEFKFIELDDSYSTGSSIMPQKKNPDIAELIRGKTGRVYGDLITLLTLMKALPLAYNKDMQEDKEALFDSIDTVKLCVDIFTKMFETTYVNKDKMFKACQKGFINATDCADFLVKQGLPFREAYKITGKIVAYCTQNSKDLNSLSIEEYLTFNENFTEEIYKAIDIEKCVNDRTVHGGPSPQTVSNHINMVKKG